MKTLNELGLIYGTDKSSNWHDYLKTYEIYLGARRDGIRKVLEIGVDGGASIKMWRDYFPGATIHGIDHNPKCNEIQDLGPMVQISIGDVNDAAFWRTFKENWGGNFDLIVDDGAHTTKAIANAFEVAWPIIRPGGLYIIEDLHAVYHPEYQRDLSVELFWAWWFAMIHLDVNTMGKPQRGSAPSAFEFVHFWRSLCIIGKSFQPGVKSQIT